METRRGTVADLFSSDYAEKSVKRFVLTSSSLHALGSLHDGTILIQGTWNEVVIQKASGAPPVSRTRK